MLVGRIKKMGREKYVILLLCDNDLMVQISVNDRDIDVIIVT